jgi:hypothetical protein
MKTLRHEIISGQSLGEFALRLPGILSPEMQSATVHEPSLLCQEGALPLIILLYRSRPCPFS